MQKIDTEGEHRLPVSIFFSFEKIPTFLSGQLPGTVKIELFSNAVRKNVTGVKKNF